MLIIKPPHIAYKYLLDKGEDLTASEIVYLRNKEVSMKRLINATVLKKEAIHSILNHADKYIENHKKVVMEMGKFNLTQAEYNDHKAQGKTDDDIAKAAGVSAGTLHYHKKQWLKAEVKPRTPKLVLAENESIPSVQNDLVSDLSKKLRKSETANERQADEIASLEVELGEVKKENQDKDIEITLLKQTIDNLKKEIQDLHHAAEDAENEAAASQEFAEREQALMEDASYWRLQTQQYQAENERLNKCLAEERKDKNKYKGEFALAAGLLKAVL